MSMFHSAAEIAVKTAGAKTLHPVTDLNSAEHFRPLCIVEVGKRAFKSHVLNPTFVTLNRLLTKDLDVSAIEKQFTLLEGLEVDPSRNVSGEIGGNVASGIASEIGIKPELSGDDKMTLEVQLGDITKSEVNWEELSKELETNPVDLNNEVYKKAAASKEFPLTVVVESLCTKGDGTLDKDNDWKVATDDDLNVIKIHVKAKGSVEVKHSSSYKIPPGTVLAYGCVRFTVDRNSGIITLNNKLDRVEDGGLCCVQ